NDHLQTAAEYGIPGYLLFLGALVLLAQRSLRKTEPADELQRFVRLFAAPFAIAVFVLALAQFPLQAAAMLSQMMFAAGLCAGWSVEEEVADV
ncbi:MAG TPA: hypothetical protein VGE86_09470, partial [Thermoanaerobaculia bacterium]